MTEFTLWDILRNLLLATRWTIVLSLVSFVGGGKPGRHGDAEDRADGDQLDRDADALQEDRVIFQQPEKIELVGQVSAPPHRMKWRCRPALRQDGASDQRSAGMSSPSHFWAMAFSEPSVFASAMIAFTFSTSAGSFLLRPI